MNNITYGIIDEVYSIGTDTRAAYGIAAYADADENGTAAIVAAIHDITADKQSLTELVLMCNRLELSLIHLNDAIEDHLLAENI